MSSSKREQHDVIETSVKANTRDTKKGHVEKVGKNEPTSLAAKELTGHHNPHNKEEGNGTANQGIESTGKPSSDNIHGNTTPTPTPPPAVKPSPEAKPLTRYASEAKYAIFPGFKRESRTIFDSLRPTPSFMLPRQLKLTPYLIDKESLPPFQYDLFCKCPVFVCGAGGNGKTINASRLGNQIYDASWMKSRKITGTMHAWNVVGVYLRAASPGATQIQTGKDEGEKSNIDTSMFLDDSRSVPDDIAHCPNVDTIVTRVVYSFSETIASLVKAGSDKSESTHPSTFSLAGVHLYVVLDDMGYQPTLIKAIVAKYPAFQNMIRRGLESSSLNFASPSDRYIDAFPRTETEEQNATTMANGLEITVTITGRGAYPAGIDSPHLYADC